MAENNFGVCVKCRELVPVEHEIRGNRVYIKKDCPKCGPSEAIVSSDADTWQWKRDVFRFDAAEIPACRLNCNTCGTHKNPRMVFLDLTNRCNLACPICVANVPAMKFEFHPPREYFENIFKGLAERDPKPVVHFFGGEPTCRQDLFELIDLARDYGLTVYVVTNGIKLADEEYCEKLCEKDVPILLGFDGRDPAIYTGMRKDERCYEKKMAAFENLRRFSKRRQNIVMCCVAHGINDRHVGDTIAMMHEHRDHMKGLYFLPLTETWDDDRFETQVTTNIEDVQEIVDAAFDEPVEFVSLGLQHHFAEVLNYFGAGGKETFSSVHPNCESATVFFSDGEQYRPLSHFLKRPLREVAEDAVAVCWKLGEELDREAGPRSLGNRMKAVKAFGGFWKRSINTKRVMDGAPALVVPLFMAGLAAGKPLGEQLRKHTLLRDPLKVLVLPFEETHSLESDRLIRCASGFAYEDVATGEVKTIPACAWWLYNIPILKAIQAKYDKQTG